MRKIITLLIVLFTVPVFGQNHFIGMKGGINYANVISDNFLIDNDYRNGFIGGLTYEYEFKKKFHFGLDLVYAQKDLRMISFLLTRLEIQLERKQQVILIMTIYHFL